MSRTISDLTDLITTYYPKIRKIFRQLVSIKDIPITFTQLTCLSIIEKHGQLTMSDLANELSMSNQQLTKVVDALVDFDMVERRYDDGNRRKVFAKTTERGKQTLTSLREELSKKLDWMLHKFSDDEMDKLYDCFAHIASYFGYKEEK